MTGETVGSDSGTAGDAGADGNSRDGTACGSGADRGSRIGADCASDTNGSSRDGTVCAGGAEDASNDGFAVAANGGSDTSESDTSGIMAGAGGVISIGVGVVCVGIVLENCLVGAVSVTGGRSPVSSTD